MRRLHSERPALITSAPESSEREYEHRRRRYALMMAGRAAAVLAAALTYRISLWLALGCCVAGAVLPWAAVILANDGPPKQRAHRPAPGTGGQAERALPAPDDERTVDG